MKRKVLLKPSVGINRKEEIDLKLKKSIDITTLQKLQNLILLLAIILVQQ